MSIVRFLYVLLMAGSLCFFAGRGMLKLFELTIGKKTPSKIEDVALTPNLGTERIMIYLGRSLPHLGLDHLTIVDGSGLESFKDINGFLNFQTYIYAGIAKAFSIEAAAGTSSCQGNDTDAWQVKVEDMKGARAARLSRCGHNFTLSRVD